MENKQNKSQVVIKLLWFCLGFSEVLILLTLILPGLIFHKWVPVSPYLFQSRTSCYFLAPKWTMEKMFLHGCCQCFQTRSISENSLVPVKRVFLTMKVDTPNIPFIKKPFSPKNLTMYISLLIAVKAKTLQYVMMIQLQKVPKMTNKLVVI